MEPLVQIIKSTMDALSIPTQTTEANRRLVEFEQSREAWDILTLLLRESPGSSYRFFASISLYSKIQRDLTTQIDMSIMPGFTLSLIDQLIRLTQETTIDKNVCRYICLSIAATAVQLNQDGVINQIFAWLNPILTTAPQVVLELLILLPEECFNKNVIVSNDTRHLFALQLTRSVPEVFAFLQYITSQSVLNEETGCQVLKCLDRWIDNTDIEGSVLSTHPIFLFMLESFARPEFFEQAIETAITALRRFRCSDKALIAALFPRAVAMSTLWRTNVAELLAAEDPEDLEDQANICRAICRLATEAAEACLPVIVGDEDNEQMALLALLIDCVSYKYDFGIARIPLRLFYEISDALLGSDGLGGKSDTDGFEPGEDYEYSRGQLVISPEARTRFTTVFEALFEAILQQLVIPDSDFHFAGIQKSNDSLADKRDELRDGVVDCLNVIGPLKCLQTVCRHLQEAVAVSPDHIRWPFVESLLFAAQSIPAHIVDDESSALFIQLLSFVPQLPNLKGFKITIFGLIKSSARLIKRNPSLLTTLLPSLLQSLADADLCEPAAHAICVICCTCATAEELPISQLFELLGAMRLARTLPLACDLYLMEGLVAVVSHLPVDQRPDGLSRLLTPVVQRLTSSLQTSTSDQPAVNADIDRITCVLRYIEIDRVVLVQAFSQLFSVFQAILQVYTSESTCEKVCRCYKHVIKNAEASLLPALPALLTHLQERFEALPYSAFIYAISVCVSQYARIDRGAYVDVLYSSIWNVSTSLFAKLNSFESFQAKPDLIEEYFYLLKKTIDNCPLPFLKAPSNDSLLQAGITALKLHHREAQKCVMLFFESLVQLPTDLVARRYQEADIQLASSIIFRYGPGLVTALFQSLSGQTPAYALDENNGCICDVLWRLNVLSGQALQEWIAAAIPLLPESARNVARQLDLLGVLPRANRDGFSRVIRDFERCCRRR